MVSNKSGTATRRTAARPRHTGRRHRLLRGPVPGLEELHRQAVAAHRIQGAHVRRIRAGAVRQGDNRGESRWLAELHVPARTDRVRCEHLPCVRHRIGG